MRAQDPECTFCEKTNNAYPLLKSLSIPFSGTDAWDEYNDSYNFHLSQLRICIEMCFGRLTTKWRIFRSKLMAAHGTAVTNGGGWYSSDKWRRLGQWRKMAAVGTVVAKW